MKNLTSIKKVLFGVALLGISSLSSAIPTLQLGIAGGTYDAATQTIVASSSSFSLYAYLIADRTNPITDLYSVSMAVTPQINSPANLGSFSVNGSPINVTAGMVYGIPPLDATIETTNGGDSHDLQSHSIFPTYFTEKTFSFSAANQSSAFNTADHPSWGPQAGSGMYFQKFDIDVTNLDPNYAIHFDLYNTELLTCKKSATSCVPGNLDITQFAPFSHDAQSGNGDGGGGGNEVPEPTPLMLLGVGLLGIGVARRKVCTV
jgi:PEP-CTERM motif